MNTRIRADIVIIIISILSMLILACEKPPSGTGHYTNGFKYHDPAYQEEILKELKKRDVPILIADNGYATYPNDFIDEVNEILKDLDNRPYTEFYKTQYADNFVSILKENHIDYRIKYLNDNKVQVYWNNKDDELVRELEQKNTLKIFNREK